MTPGRQASGALDARGHRTRLAWADAAKGLCIILVVLHHVVGKHLAAVVPDELAEVEAGWAVVTYGLKPLRMPLFFLVSGLFAAAAIHRPWRDVVPARVLTPYYLYAVWLCLHTVVFLFARDLAMNRTRDLGELVADLAYASTGLWYLYALVAYFLLTKAVSGIDPRIVTTVAAAVAVTAPLLPIDAYNRVSVLQHFVYFAVGALFPAAVRAVADSRQPGAIPVLTVTYVALSWLMLNLDVGRGPRILLLSVLAVPLALRCAVVVSTWRRVGRAATFVGRRTLPVYVLHMPVLALAHELLDGTVLPSAAAGAVLAAVHPLAVAAVVTGVCLLVGHAVARGPLWWLLRRPSRGGT